MADTSDVENTLAGLITGVLYPNGTGQPSIVNTPCKIFRGWPLPSQLDSDAASGTIDVSIYPTPQESRTTKYPTDYQPCMVPIVTMTATATVEQNPNTITLAGIIQSPLNVAAIVNKQAFVYTTQPSDTLMTATAALAALINAQFPGTTSSGAIITVPYTYVIARVGGLGTVISEIKRQKKKYQITFWCPNGAGNGVVLRDQIVPPVDVLLGNTIRLALPDGSYGMMYYEGTHVSDLTQKELIYRRDLFYSVEYGTTQTQSTAQIVAEIFALTGGLDPSFPVIEQFAI